MILTHRKKNALAWLRQRHDEYPNTSSFLACHLGRNTAAILRKLEPTWLVKIDRLTGNVFRYYITDAGREALK